MRIDRSILGWGVFFIILGSVPLAVRSGAIDGGLAARAWELWPLLLIGAGLGLLLAKTRVAVFGALVVSTTLGLMAGGLLAGGIGLTPGITACGMGSDGMSQGTALEERRGTFGPGATVDLSLDCGTLTVASAGGQEWVVSGGPETRGSAVITASADHLAVRTPDGAAPRDGSIATEVAVTLPQAVPMDLAVAVNAGAADLELSLLSVGALNLQVNAGEIRAAGSDMLALTTLNAEVNAGSLVLSLPTPDTTLNGSLTVNVGSIDVCVPAGVGLQIIVRDDALGDTNFDERGLGKSGNTWTLPGYETATQRIDLDASANLGSITLNPEGGCG